MTNITLCAYGAVMADETDDTDATEDEARQARHGRSCGGSYGAESFT